MFLRYSRVERTPAIRASEVMIAVLYATMTGNAEACAIDLAGRLKNGGLVCKLENLASYKAQTLGEEEVALFVVSTWGEGEPPDDVVPLFEELQNLETAALLNLRFAVFALGDSSYDVFCGFGKDCDRLLEQAGATRLRECECCDLNHDERLPNWAREIATLLAKQNPQLVSE